MRLHRVEERTGQRHEGSSQVGKAGGETRQCFERDHKHESWFVDWNGMVEPSWWRSRDQLVIRCYLFFLAVVLFLLYSSGLGSLFFVIGPMVSSTTRSTSKVRSVLLPAGHVVTGVSVEDETYLR